MWGICPCLCMTSYCIKSPLQSLRPSKTAVWSYRRNSFALSWPNSIWCWTQDVFWQLFHSCNYSVKCCARKHLLPAVTDQTSVKSTFWTQKRKWQKSGHGSECVVSADGSLAITRWMDNRIVALVSNFIAVEEGDIVRRCIRAKNRSVDVKWQAVINACNYSMVVSIEWTSDFFLKDYHSLIKGDIENDVSFYEPYSGERLPWVQVWRGQRAFLGSPISLTSS